MIIKQLYFCVIVPDWLTKTVRLTKKLKVVKVRYILIAKLAFISADSFARYIYSLCIKSQYNWAVKQRITSIDFVIISYKLWWTHLELKPSFQSKDWKIHHVAVLLLCILRKSCLYFLHTKLLRPHQYLTQKWTQPLNLLGLGEEFSMRPSKSFNSSFETYCKVSRKKSISIMDVGGKNFKLNAFIIVCNITIKLKTQSCKPGGCSMFGREEKSWSNL